MVVDFDKDYQINQIRHQRYLDEAQSERDWREARGYPPARTHRLTEGVTHFFAALHEGWVAGRDALRGDGGRRHPSLHPK